MINKGINVLG